MRSSHSAVLVAALTLLLALGCRQTHIAGEPALAVLVGTEHAGPHQSVSVLHQPPDGRFTDLGMVMATYWEPLDGVNNMVPAPWWSCGLPDADAERPADRLASPEPFGRLAPLRWYQRKTAEPLHDALRAEAAARGANAVILRASGLHEDGTLWITGRAIRRR